MGLGMGWGCTREGQYTPQESARTDWAPGPMQALEPQGQADQVVTQGNWPPASTQLPLNSNQSGEASRRKRSERSPAKGGWRTILHRGESRSEEERALGVPGWGRSEWQPQKEGLFFMAGVANWDPGTNQTHSHTLAAFRENVCQSCLPSRHCRAWRVMQVSRTEPDTDGVQQTEASCGGPALGPRTLAAAVPLLLWPEPQGPHSEICRQVGLSSILKTPNGLSDESLGPSQRPRTLCGGSTSSSLPGACPSHVVTAHTGRPSCGPVPKPVAWSKRRTQPLVPSVFPPPSTLASLHVLPHAPPPTAA
uniref:Uncharacterized protein n=1 Tax=Myotis myotis TaxID=51298 RepID=A0A7J7XIP9_MYOMY|nr:hypothetical protein mMyoMyo1_011736 [Myotis myotis]